MLLDSAAWDKGDAPFFYEIALSCITVSYGAAALCYELRDKGPRNIRAVVVAFIKHVAIFFAMWFGSKYWFVNLFVPCHIQNMADELVRHGELPTSPDLPYIEFNDVLQVNPAASSRIFERVYRDTSLGGSVRAVAITCGTMGPRKHWDHWLQDAMRDPDPNIRKEAKEIYRFKLEAEAVQERSGLQIND